jgi:hypothetical protein
MLAAQISARIVACERAVGVKTRAAGRAGE